MADEYILRSMAIERLTALEATDPFATIADAKRVLADMAAADAAKVVHGKWGDNGIAGSMLVKCSVCGFDCGSKQLFLLPELRGEDGWRERQWLTNISGAQRRWKLQRGRAGITLRRLQKSESCPPPTLRRWCMKSGCWIGGRAGRTASAAGAR